MNLPIGAPGAPYIPACTKHLAKNHTLSFSATHKPKSTNTPTITWDRRVRHTHHPPAGGRKNHPTATASKNNRNHYPDQPAHRCV